MVGLETFKTQSTSGDTIQYDTADLAEDVSGDRKKGCTAFVISHHYYRGFWWLSRLAMKSVKHWTEGTTPPVCHLELFSLHPPATNLGQLRK